MENIFLVLFSFPIMCVGFAIVTWLWWKISRSFFIFLAYFSDKLKLKNGSWKKILFNYGVFGPLGLTNISGYLYTLLIVFKNLS